MGWDSLIETNETSSTTTKFVTHIKNDTQRPSTVVGIDFETYYGTNYSLRKLTTTLYVRGLRPEEIHGASISVNGETPKWYRGDDLRKHLSGFDWENTAVLAHNTAFDGFILYHHYGITPAYFYDTMSMARGLHSHDIGAGLDEVAKYYGLGGKVAGSLASIKGKRWHEMTPVERVDLEVYCDNDVEIMWKIFGKMVDKYPEDELDLIDLSIKAFARPLLMVDNDLVIEEQRREVNEQRNLLERVAEHSGMDVPHIRSTLSSNPQFADLLRKYDVEPPMKVSPSDETKETYAFAKNDIPFQQLAVHPNPDFRDLVQARLAIKSTIGLSRAARVSEHSEDGRRPIPIMLNYCKAHTMRWTGGDKINPQNFPSGRTSSKLRYTLVAPKGKSIVVIDSSQIEDRMNAYVAGQMDVLEAYRNNEDNYKLMASRIYDRPVEQVTKQQRFVGKVARLGLGYQCGAKKFTDMLRSGAMGPPVYEDDLANSEIENAHRKYRYASQQVVENWWYMSQIINYMEMGKSEIITSKASGAALAQVGKEHILMPNGLKLHYPKLSKDEEGNIVYQANKHFKSKIYGGLLTENFVQCLARIVVGEQMLLIAKEFPVVMMTHDEVVFLADDSVAEDAYKFGLECMRYVPDWCPNLPINADGGYGKTYGDVK